MPKKIESQAEFDQVTAKGNVVVDFFAGWCMPCRKMGEVIDEIEPTRSDVTFVKVDVDQHPEIAQKFGVYSIPQINLFKEGKEVEKLVGFRYKSEFEDILNKSF